MANVGYHKSRLGCQRCKRRKVKCDESVPCSACKRHGVQCSLLLGKNAPPARTITTTTMTSSSNGISPQSSPGGPVEASADEIQRNDNRGGPSTTVSPPAQLIAGVERVAFDQTPPLCLMGMSSSPDRMLQSDSWMADLELLHHYIAATSKTLPSSESCLAIWQETIPRIAFQAPYLMHQILATSALHLAYLQPAKRNMYIDSGIQHQTEHLSDFYLALGNANEASCHALFAAASLLSVGAFAKGAVARNTGMPCGVSDLIEVIVLIRGMGHILSSFEDAINHGVLGPLVRLVQRESEDAFLISIAEHLSQLDLSNVEDLHVRQICYTESSRLAKSINRAQATSAHARARVAMAWASRLEHEFVALLQNRHPAALIVVSYHVVVLYAAALEFWFFAGWGRSVLADIKEIVGSEWADKLAWQLSLVDRMG